MWGGPAPPYSSELKSCGELTPPQVPGVGCICRHVVHSAYAGPLFAPRGQTFLGFDVPKERFP